MRVPKSHRPAGRRAVARDAKTPSSTIRKGLVCVTALLAASLATASAMAQTAPIDDSGLQAGVPRTVVFGAWESRCAPAVQPGTESCLVASSITVPVAGGQRAVAAVVIVQAAPQTGSVQLVVQLPNSVWLPPGVRVETAEGELVAQIPFAVCSSNACEAGAVLDADQWARVGATTTSLTLRYELQGQQVAKLDFSMDGFAAAATSVGLAPA